MAMTFNELPVGACFAFSPTARRATGKKTGTRSALLLPGGRPTVVRMPNLPVRVMACRLSSFLSQAPKPRFRKEKVAMPRRSLTQTRPPERFLVVGPRNKPRRIYTDFEDAVKFAHRCSKLYAGGLCRVAQGWPGAERVVVECLQDKCQRVKNGVLAQGDTYSMPKELRGARRPWCHPWPRCRHPKFQGRR